MALYRRPLTFPRNSHGAASFHTSTRRSRSLRSNRSFRSSPPFGSGTRTRGRTPAASRSLTVHGDTPRYAAVPSRSRSLGGTGATARQASALPLASDFSEHCAGDVPGTCPYFRGRPTGRRAWSRGRSSLIPCFRFNHCPARPEARRALRLNDPIVLTPNHALCS